MTPDGSAASSASLASERRHLRRSDCAQPSLLSPPARRHPPVSAIRSGLDAEDLAGIHDAVRVECGFDRPVHVEDVLAELP